ncbi:MAG: M48 family metallopeptidase [Bacteroidales bacterium]|nr:M48 family metallopeptidase [Bacteroidales bacterium]
MENRILLLLLLFYIFSFLFESIIDVLNYRHSIKNKPLPVISDVYSFWPYRKHLLYTKANAYYNFLRSGVTAIITIIVIWGGVLTYLDAKIATFAGVNLIYRSVLFFGVLWLLELIVSTPFSYFHTFTIEERFGFNKTTKKLFWVDLLKSTLLSLILGGIILFVVSWLFYTYPNNFWIPILILLIVISFISSVLYTRVILPLFNKKSPLPDGELKTSLYDLSEKAGFPVNSIYVIDSSKRSTKANAFFTGFGRTKRIYLYDTLINNLNPVEIAAVLAHEIGHYKKKHTWINLLLSILVTGVYLFVFNYLCQINLFDKAFGVTLSQPSLHFNLIGFVLLTIPIQFILSPITSFISRKMEYAADGYAVKLELGESLIAGLKKLASLNFQNLNPLPLYVWINYSHPPLASRVGSILQSIKN